MKTKLLRRLRKAAQNRYRLHTFNGDFFWIQKFDSAVCHWFLFGTHSYPDIVSAKKAITALRRNWILAKLHDKYGNRKASRINKIIHSL